MGEAPVRIWPEAYVSPEFDVISEVRFESSANPAPVLLWKFWANPHAVPEPPINVTGVTSVTLIV